MTTCKYASEQYLMSCVTSFQVITGILSLPKSYRILLFGWLKDYESEYFARIIKVLQNYLSFTCEDSASNLDSSPPVLVLERYSILI